MSGDNDRFTDFEYIVELQIPQKVCFLSTTARNTTPIGFPNTGPGRYDVEKATASLHKHRQSISKYGVAPLADKSSRFQGSRKVISPGPAKYNLIIDWSAVRPSPAPFNTSEVHKDKYPNTPGPTDVNKHWKCRKSKIMYNFGRPRAIDAVETMCVNKPTDICIKCAEICKGDYWQKDYSVYLCHLCREEEKCTQEIFNRTQLKEFKKIRNCSFMHSHEGTDAAIRILPSNKIRRKVRMENYLDLYLTCD